MEPISRFPGLSPENRKYVGRYFGDGQALLSSTASSGSTITRFGAGIADLALPINADIHSGRRCRRFRPQVQSMASLAASLSPPQFHWTRCRRAPLPLSIAGQPSVTLMLTCAEIGRDRLRPAGVRLLALTECRFRSGSFANRWADCNRGIQK